MGIRYPFYIKHHFNPGVTWRKRWTELPPKHFISRALPFRVRRWPGRMQRPGWLGEKQTRLLSLPGLETEICERSLSLNVISPMPGALGAAGSLCGWTRSVEQFIYIYLCSGCMSQLFIVSPWQRGLPSEMPNTQTTRTNTAIASGTRAREEEEHVRHFLGFQADWPAVEAGMVQHVKVSFCCSRY